MVDIRDVCKIFLDFIYDNSILPDDIENILKNKKYKSQWDIRKICEVLAYKNNYQRNNGERFTEMIREGKKLYLDQELTYNIYNVRNTWKTIDETILNWLDKSQTLLDLIIDKLNEFFHNVDQDIGLETVYTAFYEIIAKAPNTFKKDNYLNKIKKQTDPDNHHSYTKKSEQTNDTTTEKYIVAYFFSNYEHYDIYPTLTQTEAITKAAEILGTTYYNLKQMRDQFDAHYRDISFEDRETRKKIGRRIGYVAPLCSTQQKIKDDYDMKSQDEVISIVKDILGINR